MFNIIILLYKSHSHVWLNHIIKIKRGYKMKPIKIEPIRRITLTTVEVAEYLGVSKETVYNHVREKAIDHFRIGSKILFKIDAIDNWMDIKVVSGLDDDE